MARHLDFLYTLPLSPGPEEPLALDKKVLSLAAARKINAASEAEARSRGLGVVIVVVDDAGNLIQLSRIDEAQVASVNVGIGKAPDRGDLPAVHGIQRTYTLVGLSPQAKPDYSMSRRT